MERLVGKYIFGLKISAGKTIFLTSPRQVGKTTFARNWLFSERVEDTHFDCAKW
jgi:predicted AAA+ superfamily ATPase